MMNSPLKFKSEQGKDMILEEGTLENMTSEKLTHHSPEMKFKSPLLNETNKSLGTIKHSDIRNRIMEDSEFTKELMKNTLGRKLMKNAESGYKTSPGLHPAQLTVGPLQRLNSSIKKNHKSQD